MTTLLENPIPILLVGILVEAVLGVIFMNNRRGIVLLPMAGVLVFVLLGVLLEWVVVTEREEVEATLDGLAAAIEANDLERALSYVSPKVASAEKTRRRARWAMNRFEVREAKIRNLEIKINRLTSPPSAKATFNGILSLTDRKGEYPYNTHPIGFTVEFRKEGDRWLLTKHTESVPQLGSRNEGPR